MVKCFKRHEKYFHFLSFVNIDIAHIVEPVFVQCRETCILYKSMPWLLMTWRSKEPSHQQPCYCSISHYTNAILGTIASQITSLTIVYSIVYSDADQRKHQSSASLAFMWGIHRGPVNSPHKWPVTRKMFPFDDVVMPPEYSRSSAWGGVLILT